MENQMTILGGYTDLEKGAYLGAIASLTTADRVASPEEAAYLEALCEAAGLSDHQNELIRNAASTEMTDQELNRCLDVLKTSDLRFSFVTDMIAFANADKNYSPEEKQVIEKMAAYLGVDANQYSLLDQFTRKAVAEAPAQHANETNQTTETSPNNFLGNLGFNDQLKSAGINTNSLMKGALAIIGPMIMAKMMSGGRRSRGGMFGGGGGGLLGGLLGGGLSGGGGSFRNAGGLLGRILGGNRRF